MARSDPVDMSAVRPVQVRRLTDEVAEKIRAFILDENLVEGTRLPSERSLAEMLGASRPTVSQALRSLSLMGLVEIRRGSGAYVLRQPDRSVTNSLNLLFELERENVASLVELRLWLEQLGVREAARRGSPADMVRLRESLARLAASVGETSTWIAADTVFHATVVGLSKNPFLTAIYESTHTAVIRYEYQRWVDDDEVPSWLRPDAADSQLAIHEPIVAALEAGDVDAAQTAVLRHNEVMREHLDSAGAARRPASDAGRNGRDTSALRCRSQPLTGSSSVSMMWRALQSIAIHPGGPMPPLTPRRLRTGRRLRAGCAVLAVAALTLSACTKSDDSSGGSGGGDDDGPIVIGTSLPLTGEFSQPGTAAKEGYEIWAETVNAEGGLLGRDVELTIKDDASNQNTVVADYNALVQDSDLLLGTFSSLLNLPASAVAERNQMLYIEPAGGSPEIFSRGFKFLFFAQQSTADKQGDVFATWLSQLPEDERPKTAAYPTLDDPFAGPTSEGIEKILSDAGIETVYRETYSIDTKNFDTIVNAMKAENPDIVVNGAQTEDGIGVLRSMLKADFTPDWLYQTNAPSLGDQYSDAVGVENTEGVFYSISHSPEASTPGNAEFVEAYNEKFGGPPPEDAADAYAAGQVLATAVEEVGSIEDQEALADWLHENEVQTILGPLSWNEDGSPIGEFLTGQWQNGKTEIVLPPEAATSDEIVMGWEPGGAR